MSAFGGKADIKSERSLLPLLTQSGHHIILNEPHLSRYGSLSLSRGATNEAARIHYSARCCSRVATGGASATGEQNPSNWISRSPPPVHAVETRPLPRRVPPQHDAPSPHR